MSSRNSPAKIRNHWLWKERESVASPKERAAQDVGYGLGAWVSGGKVENSGQDEDADSEHEAADGREKSSQYEPTQSPARVRKHRLWRERESAASPKGRAAQDVGHVLGAWAAGGKVGSSGQDEDADSEHEAASGSGMIRQEPIRSPARVREHRLWRERESAASPKGRAAQDVGHVLGAWAAGGKVGSSGQDAASAHEAAAGNNMSQLTPTQS
ncbi:hypothetical protein DUNSADRAFT_4658, partial [Dunaliella salina]